MRRVGRHPAPASPVALHLGSRLWGAAGHTTQPATENQAPDRKQLRVKRHSEVSRPTTAPLALWLVTAAGRPTVPELSLRRWQRCRAGPPRLAGAPRVKNTPEAAGVRPLAGASPGGSGRWVLVPAPSPPRSLRRGLLSEGSAEAGRLAGSCSRCPVRAEAQGGRPCRRRPAGGTACAATRPPRSSAGPPCASPRRPGASARGPRDAALALSLRAWHPPASSQRRGPRAPAMPRSFPEHVSEILPPWTCRRGAEIATGPGGDGHVLTPGQATGHLLGCHSPRSSGTPRRPGWGPGRPAERGDLCLVLFANRDRGGSAHPRVGDRPHEVARTACRPECRAPRALSSASSAPQALPSPEAAGLSQAAVICDQAGLICSLPFVGEPVSGCTPDPVTPASQKWRPSSTRAHREVLCVLPAVWSPMAGQEPRLSRLAPPQSGEQRSPHGSAGGSLSPSPVPGHHTL